MQGVQMTWILEAWADWSSEMVANHNFVRDGCLAGFGIVFDRE